MERDNTTVYGSVITLRRDAFTVFLKLTYDRAPAERTSARIKHVKSFSYSRSVPQFPVEIDSKTEIPAAITFHPTSRSRPTRRSILNSDSVIVLGCSVHRKSRASVSKEDPDTSNAKRLMTVRATPARHFGGPLRHSAARRFTRQQ